MSEKYLDTAGVQARMRELGIARHYDYWKAAVRDCPHSVRAEVVRFSDLWNWWSLSPEWRPFARRVRLQRSLAAASGRAVRVVGSGGGGKSAQGGGGL